MYCYGGRADDRVMHERAPGSRGGANPWQGAIWKTQPARQQELPGGGMWPFTCDPRRAQDGGVTASRDVGGTSIGKKVSGHDDGR
jgi:hypothetical protein